MPQVFFDAAGTRRRIVHRILAWFGGIALILGAVFTATLFEVPALPSLLSPATHSAASNPLQLPPRPQAMARHEFNQLERQLRTVAATRKKSTTPASGKNILGAYYAPWEETGLHSLRANAGSITHLFPVWLHLNQAGTGLDLRDWDPEVNIHNADVISIARQNGIKIIPVLDNSTDGVFGRQKVRALLSSPSASRQLVANLTAFIQTNRFDGLNLDFENLDDSDWKLIPAFIASLRAALPGKFLAIDVEAEANPQVVAELATQVDRVILMAYDEHDEGGDAGPIASAPWTESVLEKMLSEVPEDKVILGVGAYSYDWTAGKKAAEPLSYQEAITLAADNHEGEPPEDIISLDDNAINSTFGYVDESGKNHRVWMLDAISGYNQARIGRAFGIRDMAVWSLGTEDPTLWKALQPGTKPAELERMVYPYGVDYFGEGEILRVRSEPKEGLRRLKTDPDTGLIVDATYQKFGSPYEIERRGKLPRAIALTFDDGPDPVYSPQILDILKKEGVPATFFVIGQNAEKNPQLLRRMLDDGHEIGSHTYTHPNLGRESDLRIELELNTTQRAIQSLLGRSTLLFRPPYNADAEPTSREEVMPVVLAARLGYITVGELIDPQDWNPRNDDGSPRTAEEIADLIVRGAKKGEGNCVLLHDGGGNRDATVAALRLAIPRLKQAGFRFVPVSALTGKTRDQIMPPITSAQMGFAWVDQVVFGFVYTFLWILAVAFTAGILLGIARVLLIVPLALSARRNPGPPFIAGFQPTVTALIAAYNEEKVIVATVQSVLASDYPLHQVIVIDDGSQDATSARVQEAFADDPRVRLITKPNGGKASALNHGIEAAQGEILFCIDADTVLAPDAIRRLVPHFADGKVAAVAGNVRVGNPDKLLTRWQSIEYITSQNIDRAAYGQMNAITVVPGAIGAWRKSALAEVGGYGADTLAEDMDLTWRLRRAGWKLATETEARAYTEAPDTWSAFFKQRFRWSYGTLQCLWKHRGAMGRYGWFGWFALPTLWLFQVVFNVLAPLIDLQVAWAAVTFLGSWVVRGTLTKDWQPSGPAGQTLLNMALLYAVFTIAELLAGVIAYRMERANPRELWALPIQRLCYRQVMYAVIFKAIGKAITGARTGWGKLDRKATSRIGK
jgi:peptidoglycan/xylan/chitin deacetylase (PgdA/CDA1 family)/spore germination protein YaaH/glycosyltransferase involved in cell wall biosynthesis